MRPVYTRWERERAGKRLHHLENKPERLISHSLSCSISFWSGNPHWHSLVHLQNQNAESQNRDRKNAEPDFSRKIRYHVAHCPDGDCGRATPCPSPDTVGAPTDWGLPSQTGGKFSTPDHLLVHHGLLPVVFDICQSQTPRGLRRDRRLLCCAGSLLRQYLKCDNGHRSWVMGDGLRSPTLRRNYSSLSAPDVSTFFRWQTREMGMIGLADHFFPGEHSWQARLDKAWMTRLYWKQKLQTDSM